MDESDQKHMKEDIIEYHPNGSIKHRISYYPNGSIKHKTSYYPNGNKSYERFYDQKGYDHREPGLPDYQDWFDNGITYRKTYTVHGWYNNIYNPADIYFFNDGKIDIKYYQLNINYYSKLNWQNSIKNIS